MKLPFSELGTAFRATLVFALICCALYPLVVLGLGQLLFPHQANGSLVEGSDRSVIGSTLLGQNFTGANYFHPRPSAAGANGYDAVSSSGSNLGPTSKKLIDVVKTRVDVYRTVNGLAAERPRPRRCGDGLRQWTRSSHQREERFIADLPCRQGTWALN